MRTLIVLGPFMPTRKRSKLLRKGSALPHVEIIEFNNRMDNLIAGARAVVGMCGYNTFCEILSFDKPALIVPRTAPRQEQYLRAARAEQLGLVRMLPDDGRRLPGRMAAQLRALPGWPVPNAAAIPGLLGGLERISGLARPWLATAPAALTAHG